MLHVSINASKESKSMPKTATPKSNFLSRCSDCELCVRDTSGPSFNLVTKEYFMGSCPKGHADGRVFHQPDGTVIGKVFMGKARLCTDFLNHQTIMSTVRYSQYVVVNEATGTIVWHGSLDNAKKDQEAYGGRRYDFNKDNHVIIERALHAARQRMGVE